jgi:RNA-binding protein YhbY
LLLKQKGLSDDILVAIKQILEESDLVKFAKSHPSENDILKVSAIARQVIYQTSPIETDFVD